MSHDSSFVQKRILVVDDHEIILNGTINTLQNHYPDAEICTAKTADDALQQVTKSTFDLVLLDLSIPQQLGDPAQTEIGLQLLKTLMQRDLDLNLTVQSTHVKVLIRIRPEIDQHRGGFTIADKSLSSQEMLTRIDWALQGITHTKDISNDRIGVELKPEWLTVLQLAFQDGLQDQAIAEHMHVSERTVRNYWSKIYDILGIYPDDDRRSGRNSRIQTEKRAREAGLID